MKYRMTLALALVLTMLCAAQAVAQAKRQPISQMAEGPVRRWQQTYEAYGRTIEVDAEIHMPKAQAVPVIKVKAAAPIAEPMYREQSAWYTQAEANDPINFYSFRSTSFHTMVTHAVPPAWGKTRDCAFVEGAMGENEHDLYQYELDAAYADNNPLTLREASETAVRQAQQLFPNTELALRNVYLSDRTFWKKSKEYISEMGSYHFTFAQVFHGIPFMTSIHSTFSAMLSSGEDPWLDFRGKMNASVYGAEAWSISCCFYEECGVLHKDIPILSFDAVKEKVEALILSGHVRWVDDISLGYVQFDTDNPDEPILVPCWVVWCEYHAGGALSERSASKNGRSSLMYDGNNEWYRPLVINAQTGALIDPESGHAGRSACPPVLTE